MGLGAAVFAAAPPSGEAIARRLEAGAVCVNDAAVNYFALEAPMGGIKESGIGVRHGPEGIRKYCTPRTILVTPRRAPRREPQIYPYTQASARLVRALLPCCTGADRLPCPRSVAVGRADPGPAMCRPPSGCMHPDAQHRPTPRPRRARRRAPA